MGTSTFNMTRFYVKMKHLVKILTHLKFRTTYIEFFMGDSKFRMGQNGLFFSILILFGPSIVKIIIYLTLELGINDRKCLILI